MLSHTTYDTIRIYIGVIYIYTYDIIYILYMYYVYLAAYLFTSFTARPRQNTDQETSTKIDWGDKMKKGKSISFQHVPSSVVKIQARMEI